MTEATLLKGNSAPKTFRVNDCATSQHELLPFKARFSSVKGLPFGSSVQSMNEERDPETNCSAEYE